MDLDFLDPPRYMLIKDIIVNFLYPKTYYLNKRINISLFYFARRGFVPLFSL